MLALSVVFVSKQLPSASMEAVRISTRCEEKGLTAWHPTGLCSDKKSSGICNRGGALCACLASLLFHYVKSARLIPHNQNYIDGSNFAPHTVSMSGFGHLFKNHKAYSAFRPTYPADLYEHIYKFADLQRYDLAVDIATGSGQAAIVLAMQFQKVIAQDQSEDQLQGALSNAHNVEYQPAKAEDTGLPNACADLVTTAQAMHWFELPAFYREVRRILKPSGSFAAWGYDLCEFENAEANKVLEHLYNGVLGPYWSERRRLVEAQYKGMEPGPEHFGRVERLLLDTMSTDLSVSALVGYISSWSAYSTYRQKHPDRSDPLVQFRNDYMKAFGFTSEDERAKVTSPLFVILAKDPKAL